MFVSHLSFFSLLSLRLRLGTTQELSCSRQELSGNTHYAVVYRKKWFVLRQAAKHRHNYGRQRRKCPPNAPHEALRFVLTPQIDGRQSPEQADIILGSRYNGGGVEGVYGPQSALSFRR